MASIGFAFLAEFAKVEANATVTAVGVGVRGVLATSEHDEITLFLAGIVNRDLGEDETTLSVTTEGPDKIYSVTQSAVMDPARDTTDWAVTAFALRIGIPLAGEGKYKIALDVGDSDRTEIDLWIKIVDAVYPQTGE